MAVHQNKMRPKPDSIKKNLTPPTTDSPQNTNFRWVQYHKQSSSEDPDRQKHMVRATASSPFGKPHLSTLKITINESDETPGRCFSNKGLTASKDQTHNCCSRNKMPPQQQTADSINQQI
jgi:hypothetical protein